MNTIEFVPETAFVDTSTTRLPPSQHLDILADFAEYVVTSDGLQQVFNEAVDIISRVLQAEYIVACELRSDGQKFYLQSKVVDPDKSFSLDGDTLRRYIMDFLVRDVMVFGEEYTASRDLAAEITGNNTISGGVSVAIPGHNHPWGLLLVCDDQNRVYSDDDVSFVRAISNLLATTFEHSRIDQDRQSNMRNVIRAKKQWESTVDVLSGIVCLIDKKGRVIRANRSLEEWGICKIVDINRKDLHHVLHPNCNNKKCSFKKAWKQAFSRVEHENTDWEVADKILNRYLHLSLKKLSADVDSEIGTDDRYAVLYIEDISVRHSENKALRKYQHDLEAEVKQSRTQLINIEEPLVKQLALLSELNDIDALVSKTRKYSYLVDDTLTGVYVLKDGEVIFCNARLAKIFNYEREELCGMRFEDLIYKEDRPLISGGMKLTAEYDVMPEDNVIRGITKEGGLVWLKNILVSAADNEHLVFDIGNVIDITEQKRIEKNLRKSEKELHVLSYMLINAQEDERKRIASELHDGLGQHLSAVKFEVESCVKMLHDKSFREEADKLKLSVRRIREAIDEVRKISMDLRPSMLDDLGILVTMEWLCRQFQEVYTNIEIELVKNIFEQDIPEALKVVIYRILQEALNNISKHSFASEVVVQIDKTSGGIILSVQDNGVGITSDKNESGIKHSLGIKSMRERAVTSGGSFDLESCPETGVHIRVTWLDKEFRLLRDSMS